MRVTSAIIIKDNKILITQKGLQGRFAKKWEFPGGKIDAGETPEECIVRELFEELQIRIEVDAFFGKCIHKYPEGENIVLAYFCTWHSGNITLTEHSAYQWVTVEELSQYDFTPADILLADKLQLEIKGKSIFSLNDGGKMNAVVEE
ncbi:8-oxo-dGTP diphosphatase MutT [Pelosinus sp. sgz500959]|uniref:8-oxo-dGTP diphosphatase MutT n=1 Tax=Pelosinus sp. sgz500959 TaxID=3242472 RepID=UPI00366A8907